MNIGEAKVVLLLVAALMITGCSDSEGGDAIYEPAPIEPMLADGETEDDWLESADGEFLYNETANRLKQRTKFTQENLDAIRECYRSGEFTSCQSVINAADEAPLNEERHNYLCVNLVESVADRLAADGSPGAFHLRPANVGRPRDEIFGITDRWIANVAYGCAKELEKSRLPPLVE